LFALTLRPKIQNYIKTKMTKPMCKQMPLSLAESPPPGSKVKDDTLLLLANTISDMENAVQPNDSRKAAPLPAPKDQANSSQPPKRFAIYSRPLVPVFKPAPSVPVSISEAPPANIPIDSSAPFPPPGVFPCPEMLPTLEDWKPKSSYTALIANAIIQSPKKKMTLNEIYTYIQNRYPYFRTLKTNWRVWTFTTLIVIHPAYPFP
jgi:hypothetical protein